MIEDLEACARSRNVTARYTLDLDDGEYVSYILGAPEFVKRSFRELFTDALPGNPTIVVVTDRTQLDQQITNTFRDP